MTAITAFFLLIGSGYLAYRQIGKTAVSYWTILLVFVASMALTAFVDGLTGRDGAILGSLGDAWNGIRSNWGGVDINTS